MNNKELVLMAGKNSAVGSVNGQTGDVVLTAESVGAATAPTVTAVTGATPTITPADNTIYRCGELTSLTISNPPATGSYVIKFDSGTTPTDVTIPPTIKGLESFAAEASTHYEINVEDNYALVASWSLA